MNASGSTRTLLIDGHVHLYSGYDWTLAVTNLLKNLTGNGRSDDPILIGILAESRMNRFYRDVLAKPSTFSGDPYQLEPGPDSGCITIRCRGLIRGYLMAGRQVVTSERLEILALGADVSTPDGLTAEETLGSIRAATAVPVLSWSPGKWFGRRGRIIRALIASSSPDRFLIGDTGLRPTFWPLPVLMRLAQQKGFTLIGGSDPLPLPGEERWVGTYGVEGRADFDTTRPADSLRQILTRRNVHFAPIGNRAAGVSFFSRWIRNQLAKP